MELGVKGQGRDSYFALPLICGTYGAGAKTKKLQTNEGRRVCKLAAGKSRGAASASRCAEPRGARAGAEKPGLRCDELKRDEKWGPCDANELPKQVGSPSAFAQSARIGAMSPRGFKISPASEAALCNEKRR